MFHKGAQFGRQAFTRLRMPQQPIIGRRFNSFVPLSDRHPKPMGLPMMAAVVAAFAIGYFGYDRTAGARMVAHENKRAAQRARQFELREEKSRSTHTRNAVRALVGQNPEPVDWEMALPALKETPEAGVKLQVSAADAERLLDGHAGVISIALDDSWTAKNALAQALTAAGYPAEEHPNEDHEERLIAIVRMLSRRVQSPAVLLLKNAKESPAAAAALQNALIEPALAGAYGVYVVQQQ